MYESLGLDTGTAQLECPHCSTLACSLSTNPCSRVGRDFRQFLTKIQISGPLIFRLTHGSRVRTSKTATATASQGKLDPEGCSLPLFTSTIVAATSPQLGFLLLPQALSSVVKRPTGGSGSSWTLLPSSPMLPMLPILSLYSLWGSRCDATLACVKHGRK